MSSSSSLTQHFRAIIGSQKRFKKLFSPSAARSILNTNISFISPHQQNHFSTKKSFSSTANHHEETPVIKDPQPLHKKLLIVYHSRTGLAADMARCVKFGAESTAAELTGDNEFLGEPVTDFVERRKRERREDSEYGSDDDVGNSTTKKSENVDISTSEAEQILNSQLVKSTHGDGRIPKSPFTVEIRKCEDTESKHLLSADGYIFCAPENLASLSGSMKEFFDRNYYPMFSEERSDKTGEISEVPKLTGRPFALAVAAGSDGTNAVNQMARICKGWRLAEVAEDNFVICNNGLPQSKANILSTGKICTDEQRIKCEELGGLVAANILMF